MTWRQVEWRPRRWHILLYDALWHIVVDVRTQGQWMSLRWALTEPIWRKSLWNCWPHTFNKWTLSNPNLHVWAQKMSSCMVFLNSAHLSCSGPARTMSPLVCTITQSSSLQRSDALLGVEAFMMATFSPTLAILEAYSFNDISFWHWDLVNWYFFGYIPSLTVTGLWGRLQLDKDP